MTERGSGTTSSQIQYAPRDALYIWPNIHSLGYANALAQRLGRDDLEITTIQILDDDGRRLRGRKFSAYVVDHACVLTDRQYDTLDQMRATQRRAS